MPQIILSTGKSFEAAIGCSILDAAARAHITLPYSCKTGRCSSCKCKVISGSTSPLDIEAGLTEQEQADGWILSCVRAAETDLRLEVDDLGSIDLPPPKTWPCRIADIKPLARSVLQVMLRLPPGAEFPFIPGQYIDVIGPNGIRRSYSLANSNFDDKVLELHIAAVNGGAMSEFWFRKAKPNDLLRLNGPLGTFFLRDVTHKDLFFLATGTGIAPVKSMLESLGGIQSDRRPKSTTVIWGGRHTQDLYMNVAAFPEGVKYVPVLSRGESEWQGATGYVQDVLLATRPNIENAAVYACGSDAMIHSAKKRLIEAGLLERQFLSDAFVSSGTILNRKL